MDLQTFLIKWLQIRVVLDLVQLSSVQNRGLMGNLKFYDQNLFIRLLPNQVLVSELKHDDLDSPDICTNINQLSLIYTK